MKVEYIPLGGAGEVGARGQGGRVDPARGEEGRWQHPPTTRTDGRRAEGSEALLRDAGVPLYLREIGAVALLTAAEEQALAAALE